MGPGADCLADYISGCAGDQGVTVSFCVAIAAYLAYSVHEDLLSLSSQVAAENVQHSATAALAAHPRSDVVRVIWWCARCNCPMAASEMDAPWLQDMAKAGANMYTFHLECPCFEQPEDPRRTEAVAKLAAAVREAGMHAGVALRPSTPVEAVMPYLEAGDFDMVRVLYIPPQPFCIYHAWLSWAAIASTASGPTSADV